MKFKKIQYGKEPIYKIKIEDETGAFMGNWTIMASDLYKFVENQRRKFGIRLTKPSGDRDLDWA